MCDKVPPRNRHSAFASLLSLLLHPLGPMALRVQWLLLVVVVVVATTCISGSECRSSLRQAGTTRHTRGGWRSPITGTTHLHTASSSSSSSSIAEFVMAAMNTSVDPCQDFYNFSCGSWLSSTPIPADKSSYTRYAISSRIAAQPIACSIYCVVFIAWYLLRGDGVDHSV
jgi:hypothetical protein